MVFNMLIMKENELFKDYALDVLRGVQNFTCIQRNYLHTVIAMENMQVLGNVIDVFKQRTGNSFATHRRPKDFGQRGKDTVFRYHDACKFRMP